MAIFDRKDLQFKHYKWKADIGDDPEYTGKADRVKLDKDEGYEVLPFIQRFMYDEKKLSRRAGQQFEAMIHEACPSEYVMRADIKSWILANWEDYVLIDKYPFIEKI